MRTTLRKTGQRWLVNKEQTARTDLDGGRLTFVSQCLTAAPLSGIGGSGTQVFAIEQSLTRRIHVLNQSAARAEQLHFSFRSTGGTGKPIVQPLAEKIPKSLTELRRSFHRRRG